MSQGCMNYNYNYNYNQLDRMTFDRVMITRDALVRLRHIHDILAFARFKLLKTCLFSVVTWLKKTMLRRV